MANEPDKIREAYQQLTGVETQRADALRVVQKLVPEEFNADIDDIRLFYLRFAHAYRRWGLVIEEIVAQGVDIEINPCSEEELAEETKEFDALVEQAADIAKYLRELSDPINTFKVV